MRPTAAAARAIQRHSDHAVEGVVGPSTYFTLGHDGGAHSTYGGPTFGSRTLRPGDSGGDVFVLQDRLAVAGRARRAADGTVGGAMGRAPARFKADAGLAGGLPTDAGTADALRCGMLAGARAVFSGRNGLDVAYVQRRLRTAAWHG